MTVGAARKFFEALFGVLDVAADDAFVGNYAKRTICCDIPMWDVWMHAESCTQWQASLAKFKKWREENPKVPITRMPNLTVPPYGSRSCFCPQCSFPIGHYGIYTVGKPCDYCGYVERRKYDGSWVGS